jgi:hypothetical protein
MATFNLNCEQTKVMVTSPLKKTIKIPWKYHRKENYPPTPTHPGVSTQSCPHRELKYWTYQSVKQEDPSDLVMVETD